MRRLPRGAVLVFAAALVATLPMTPLMAGANYVSDAQAPVSFQAAELTSEANLTVEQQNPTTAVVSWPAQDTNCANGTTVLRLTRNGATLVDNLSATATSYVDNTLAPGTYTYELRQICYKWVSPASGAAQGVQIYALPAAPTSVTATVSDGGVTVAWQYSGEDLSSFTLQRSPWPDTAWQDVLDVTYTAPGAYQYLDVSANTTTSYNYRVVAKNPAGVTPSIAVSSHVYGTVNVSGDYGFGGGASKTITIAGLVDVKDVTVDGSGSATYSKNGDQLTLNFTDGDYVQHSATDTRVSTDPTTFPETVDYSQNDQTATLSKDGPPVITGTALVPEDTKFVTGQDAADYDVDGYVGTLTQYVDSGALTPAGSGTRTVLQQATCSFDFVGAGGVWQSAGVTVSPDSIAYSDGGVQGTLYADASGCGAGTPPATQPTGTESATTQQSATIAYSGTVTWPESDTRVYKYQGDVTRPAYSEDEWTQIYSGYINDTKFNPYRFSLAVTDSRTQYQSSTFPNTIPYSSGGYAGDIPRSGDPYVISGTWTPEESKYVSGQSSSYYNDGTYSGPLTQYVAGGSAADSFYTSQSRSATCSTNYSYYSGSWHNITGSAGVVHNPDSIYYNSGGYSGTLYPGSCGVVSPPSWIPPNNATCPYTTCTRTESTTATYSGTVSKPDTRYYLYAGTVIKPAVDTRTWKQDYAGTAYMGGPSPYYQYSALVRYEAEH